MKLYMVGFPVDNNSNTHVFIKNKNSYVQRCNTNKSTNSNNVCSITKNELINFIDSKKIYFVQIVYDINQI